MGSKRAMLKNGLGDVIHASMFKSRRVFDLFTGSAAVAHHVAENYDKEVIASDLQLYSSILATSIISRSQPLRDDGWIGKWMLYQPAVIRTHLTGAIGAAVEKRFDARFGASGGERDEDSGAERPAEGGLCRLAGRRRLACPMRRIALYEAPSQRTGIAHQMGSHHCRLVLDAEAIVNECDNVNDIKSHQSSLSDANPRSAYDAAMGIGISRPGFFLYEAYSGYYFSPWQAIWLDALRQSLPKELHQKSVALASLVRAASKCAASPGHTAQPFKPNETAGPYLLHAWKLDLPHVVTEAARALSLRSARRVGRSYCADAQEIASETKEGDLVFLDPPYSGVHYSRFYHVLESVAQGKIGSVQGSGRYPPREERPFSEFSVTSKSHAALDRILRTLADNGVHVIITFPAGRASNGISGDDVKEISARHFRIEDEKISSRFSTLGGNKVIRAARQDSWELIVKLSPT